MEVCFIVKFKPQEVRDYAYDLICVTEREKFIVPVRATGNRPRVDFPDEIEFGACPIKSQTRKTFVVENTGSSSANFTLRSNHSSIICPEEPMNIEPDGSKLIEILFAPSSVDNVVAEIEVAFSKSASCFIKVTGCGKNVDVSLSTPGLTLDPAYLTLVSQKIFKVKNHSNIPINFSWKSFSTVSEENTERQRLHSELYRMQDIEEANLRDDIARGMYGEASLDGDDFDVASTESVSFEAKAAFAALVRKYRNLHTALDSDPMLFVDEIFEIIPMIGTVWPRSETEITVYFKPDTAAQFACNAFLEVSGREDRLPIVLNGTGIGPNAILSYDSFNTGDISVNTDRHYSISIYNRGEITAVWNLIPPTSKFGKKFEFTPSEGVLDVNQSQVIDIRICSDCIGDFLEAFKFALQGNEESLQCVFKGSFVGPSYHFDTNSIDFGLVSFDCITSTSLCLVNTSEVDFDFKLYVPEDGTYLKKEFEITPSEGTITPGETIEITVEFIPSSVKVYNYSLVMDMINLGVAMSRIPLSAECVVSGVRLSNRELNFGECFIRYSYEKELMVTNNSSTVSSKFEIMAQPQFTKSIATYTPVPPISVVGPGSVIGVNMILKPEKLGTLKVPVMISAFGSQEPPLQATLVCTSVGPRVSVDQTEIKWGNIECLIDSVRTLKIANTSPIDATVSLFLKYTRSKFEVSAEEFTLAPNETRDVNISANLDDTIVYKDELHVSVTEGAVTVVPLSAKGIGTTINCDCDISLIDFGVQLTNNLFERKVTLENNGRRPQLLKWSNISQQDQAALRQTMTKKISKDDPAAKLIAKKKFEPIFTVTPEEITLKPNTATTFIFKGSSAAPATLAEKFLLESKVGTERAMKKIIETSVKAEVVSPLLQCSEASIEFDYHWSKEVEPSIQQKSVILTNQTAVPLTFVFSTEAPFNLSFWEYTLAPFESTDLTIEFDPLYKGDNESHIVDKAISIVYIGHPQKDSIPIKATIAFPNLKFDKESVNFGCVLNETQKALRVRATNWSDLDVNFKWSFVEGGANAKTGGATNRKGGVPVSTLPPTQIFDVMPIRGFIKAGESQDIEFVMFGHQNSKFSGLLICEVEGGPEYKLTLSGEASVVSYMVDRTVIDFGKVNYLEKKDEELVIINQGRVPFNFSFDASNLSVAGIIEAIPSSGKVNASEKLKVILRLAPGVPETYTERVVLSVAHFDPIDITCHGTGIFPNAVVTLPRYKKVGPYGESDDLEKRWDDFMAHASSFVPSLREIIQMEIDAAAAESNAASPTKGKNTISPTAFSMTTANPPAFKTMALSSVPEPDESVKDKRPVATTARKKKAKETSQILTELEMNRLVFCDIYKAAMKKALADKAAGILVAPPKTQDSKNGMGKSRQKGSESEMLVNIEELVAGTYVCEFGNVVCGTSRKKTFKIVNASTAGPISWLFDSKVINARGFSVEPQKVEKLPEGGSVDVTVKYLARQKQKPGRVTCTMPIIMKGAPSVNILLSSKVCMPEIELSTDLIEFGQVFMGKSKRVYLRLTNVSPVSSTWSVKSAVLDPRIRLSELSGTIRPGQKKVIYAEFLPTEPRKAKAEVSFKIDMNPNPQVLHITGEGLATPIRFDPGRLELGPIFPFAAEGATQVITVHNDNDVPVEFFSLDFDKTFREEEAMLSSCPAAFDGDGLIRSDARIPGEGIPKAVLDVLEKSKVAASTEETEEEDDNLPLDTTRVLSIPPLRTGAAPRDNNLHQDIAFVGPMLSGVTTIARKAAKALQLSVSSIDNILNDVCSADSEMGVLARRVTNSMAEEEQAIIQTRLAELREKAELSKTEAADAFKKDKKNAKVKEVPESVLQTPEVAALKAFEDESNFNAENLAKIITYRMSWADAGYGFVFDGLYSKFGPATAVIDALKMALPMAVVTSISFFGGLDAYTSRLQSLKLVKTQEKSVLRSLLSGGANPEGGNDGEASPDDESLDESKRPQKTRGNRIVGNESWLDSLTGEIQSPFEDFNTLTPKQKETYTAQLELQRWEQLDNAEACLALIKSLCPETKEAAEVVPSTMEGSEPVPAKAVIHTGYTFEDFTAVILPKLEEVFPWADAKSEPISGEAPVAETEGAPADAEVKVSTTPAHGHLKVELDASDDEETSLSNVVVLLPPPNVPPDNPDKLPEPVTYQLFKRPVARADRKAIRNFIILPLESEPVAAPVEEAPKEDPKAKKDPKAKNAPVVEEVKPVQPEPTPTYRWVIAPKSSVQFRVRYLSNVEGRHESSMGFEVVGYSNFYALHLVGICELPKINTDTRNIFMRRVKSIAPKAPLPAKKFVIADEFFSFGPLLSFKKPEWRTPLGENPTEANKQKFDLVATTNADVLRLSNNGKYKCKAEVGFAGNPDAAGVFFVEPSFVDLEEGETKDVKIWAFPNAEKEFVDNIVVCVSNNPIPISYPVKCVGVDPLIEFNGPWSDAIVAAEQALEEFKKTPKPDPKKLKELEAKVASVKEAMTLDFDRVLVTRTETRTFTAKNPCLVPIAFDVQVGSFDNANCVSIQPTSGVIAVGASVTVSVSYSSNNPLMTNGSFVFRYSDVENGLTSDNANFPNRIRTNNFKIIAEAYEIKAVSLTSQGQPEGGDLLDLGIVRVGDYVKGVTKVANKGKYPIGFRISVKRPNVANVLKIEPSDGIIEPGASTDVSITFCSPSAEISLQACKDIKVNIFEPKTDEVIENFPILLTASAKYNKFRMQPAKGITFSAVRYDAGIQSKRFELRNEGLFEMAYVVCPVSHEVDELDKLDGAALACYAYYTPAARRQTELGEGYMDRVNSAGAAGGKDKGKGKDAKPPAAAKGKDAKGAADPAPAKPGVFDPDNMAPAAAPEDPLQLGAFNMSPRAGVLQPGQVASIELKFDPSGCEATREKFRVCITGVDPNDLSSKIAKSFEAFGESCLPAIVTDEIHSIFEEQQIVNSLADVTAPKSDDGEAASSGGKVDKLAVGKVVYAEVENLLAFGPVMCSSGLGKGAVEKIRITNPTKIDTRVFFKIANPNEPAAEAAKDPKAKDAKAKAPAKGKDAKADAPAENVPTIFTVQPEVWDIPPHEYRIVNVYFNPTEVKTYRAMFKAEVEEGSTSVVKKGVTEKKLEFNLAGSGTLPCIAIDFPVARAADGSLELDFNRVHVNKSMKRKLVVRNCGVMPATCLFDMNSPNMKDFIFPLHGCSLTLNAGEKQTLYLTFYPKQFEAGDDGNRSGSIKISVLHNQYDTYNVNLKGVVYSCDAMVEINNRRNRSDSIESVEANEVSEDNVGGDELVFDDINLISGDQNVSTQTFVLRSRSSYPQRFSMKCEESIKAGLLTFSPSLGHLAPDATREITVTFASSEPVKLEKGKVFCELLPIEYSTEASSNDAELQGVWDDSMQMVRPGTAEDQAQIDTYANLMKEYEAGKAEAEKNKGKKGAKPPPPMPEPCNISIASRMDDGSFMVREIVAEPKYEAISGKTSQTLNVACTAVADNPKYSCEVLNGPVAFKPTFLYQTCSYSFTLKNESNIAMPAVWIFDDAKKRGSTRAGTASSRIQTGVKPPAIPCPFTIEPEQATIAPNASKTFTMKFSPLEVDNFAYNLLLQTPFAGGEGSALPTRTLVRGDAKRPVCHFDIVERRDYLSRRQPNLKNENGQNSAIEASDIRVVHLESCGVKSRNTFRFHVLNPTNDSYEFLWESMGDPSPAWRCVLSAGTLFPGKEAEMVFEYLPEEVTVAEAFFKFKLPTMGLEQLFLFAGTVNEPKVAFSTSRIDFSNVMLGGEGGTEIIYLENDDHLPFNFAFDRMSLQNLDGPSGTILQINPKSGVVPPHAKCAIEFTFKPTEEILYNFNIVCDVKRKPNKLTLNVKGEGYAVHPILQLEQSNVSGSDASTRFVTLRPHPAVNYADFGAVQILDSVSKALTLHNNGKFNFDYACEIDEADRSGGMMTVSGARLGGTLLKGEELKYQLAFAPTRESTIDGATVKLTIAGKYIYNVVARGSGVKPALRFSFLHHDFGECFVTSPGGTPVIEEAMLQLVNHDPVANIAVECTFQKTRTLWVECQPTVLEPGGVMNVPIRFAPRDAKEFTFLIPFSINGTGKVNVQCTGVGINPRLDLANASQRRVNFGIIDVGTESRRSVALVNRSKRAMEVQLLEDGQYGGILGDRCVSYFPTSAFTIGPRQTANVQLTFSPNRRVGIFTEDLLVKYCGVTRKLLTISGKAQGPEVNFDTDSIPFGVVVLNSEKTKKLALENSGDLAISYQWAESTFGPHISISPLAGKLQPGNEVAFTVTFRPKFLDPDIRQEGITLSIPGMSPLLMTISGMCIEQPKDNIKSIDFEGVVRKGEDKKITLSNPTDKDWFISPSLDGMHWKVPNELRIPAKGNADLVVTYNPFFMAPKPTAALKEGENDPALTGKLFLAFPDGSAHLYNLKGYASPPQSSGTLTVETAAKKAAIIPMRLVNWLPEVQKFKVSVDISEKPSQATFFVTANAVEIGPSGEKDFQVRFNSFVEGNTKARITFTNPVNNEYFFYDIVAKTTMADVLETIELESSARRTARYNINIDNPLPSDAIVTMGSGKPDDWWTCDSKVVRVRELVPLSGHTEGSFEVEYRPLAPTAQPQTHLLTIMTRELGVFKYKLVVKASPPPSRQRIMFEVPLGTAQTEMFVFKTYTPAACNFNCSVQNGDIFSVAKTFTAPAVTSWDGQESKLEVQFEPMNLGEFTDVLTLTSPDGGEYTCDLIGQCIPPVPIGPFSMDKGASVDIPFRNCFSKTCEWLFSLDSPSFRITNSTASVAAKSSGSCSILFEPTAEVIAANPGGGTVHGKLFINCKTNPDIPPWIFYLKGRFESGAVAAPAGGAAPAKKK